MDSSQASFGIGHISRTPYINSETSEKAPHDGERPYIHSRTGAETSKECSDSHVVSNKEVQLSETPYATPARATEVLVSVNRTILDPEATPTACSVFLESRSRTEAPSLRAELCQAAASGDLNTLKALLYPQEEDPDYPSSFALINSPTSSGLTPLLGAAQHGQLEVVKYLVEEADAVRDLEDENGQNAFLKASCRGHMHVLKFLAGGENGTDINVSNREGTTALHNACGNGYLECVQWLVDNGAKIDAKNQHGDTVSCLHPHSLNARSFNLLTTVR